MAGEYGIERAIILPSVPTVDDPLLLHYLDRQREALIAAYDELAKRVNEFVIESQWTETIKAQIVADKNDYSLGDGVVFKLTSDAARTITGIATEIPDGHHKILINTGSFPITIAHQNTGSIAANRIITMSGTDVLMTTNGVMQIWKDGSANRWRQI